MGTLFLRRAAVALLALICWSGATHAQDFPNRAITIIVPYPPGSAPDVITRVIAEHMRGPLGQTIVVDNRAGAGGSIGMAAGARAAPDGYTISLAGSPNVLAMHTVTTPGFDLFTDFAPVGRMNNMLNALIVNSKLPVKTVKEFIDYAKANPGKLNYAASGPATPTDMGGRQFAQVHGIDFTIVSYKGSTPAAQALVSGEADFSLINVGLMLPHLQSGAVRALSITTPVKWSVMPEIPDSKETNLKVAFDGWVGLVVPTGTPQPVIAKLNAALNHALAQENTKRGAEQMGGMVLPGTPADLTALMKNDMESAREMVIAAKVEKK